MTLFESVVQFRKSIVQTVLAVTLPYKCLFFFFCFALVTYLNESWDITENLKNQNSVIKQEAGNPIPHQSRINCDTFLNHQLFSSSFLSSYGLISRKKYLISGSSEVKQDGSKSSVSLISWVHVRVLSRAQTLCDSKNCSPPGSSTHMIFQAVLDQVAISSSRGSS